jgi:peptide/nickel transport system ATP-binding protein
MLEAHRLSFSYEEGAPVLKGIDLAVAADERLALRAPSGVGKTTLCKLLAGYLLPSSGSITLDGKPLGAKGVHPVQLVCQHPEQAVDPRMRMHRTLAEAGTVPEGLLDRLGIQERWLSRYPHELSGGELQRFCIARTLMAHPRYIVADEISTMLDAVTQSLIWQVLLEETAQHHIGLVFVSHSPALTQRIATRIEALG